MKFNFLDFLGFNKNSSKQVTDNYLQIKVEFNEIIKILLDNTIEEINTIIILLNKIKNKKLQINPNFDINEIEEEITFFISKIETINENINIYSRITGNEFITKINQYSNLQELLNIFNIINQNIEITKELKKINLSAIYIQNLIHNSNNANNFLSSVNTINDKKSFIQTLSNERLDKIIMFPIIPKRTSSKINKKIKKIKRLAHACIKIERNNWPDEFRNTNF